MIRSEKEYQEALRNLQDDEAAARQQRAELARRGLGEQEVERAMAPLLSFQAQLRDEIAWYERVCRREFEPISNLTEIGRLLIALRIAKGWTQSQFAQQLGVSEAQVSRDERNEYHGITMERAQRIVNALGARVAVEVDISHTRGPIETYIIKAIKRAEFEELEGGSYTAWIEGFPGLIALGSDGRACLDDLWRRLDEWIRVSIDGTRTLPVIDSIDLNTKDTQGITHY